jgi:hypothetical protein
MREMVAAAEAQLARQGEAQPNHPIIWHDACATEDCMRPATERFEYGGVGSVYCKDCMAKINALIVARSALGDHHG